MLDLFTCVCFTTSSMIHSLLFRYCTTETEASLSVFLTRAKWVGRVSIYPHYTLCSARCLEWLISRFPFLLYFSISLILSSFFLFFPFSCPFYSLPLSSSLFPILSSLFSLLIFHSTLSISSYFSFLSIPFVFSSFHFLRILYSCFFLFLSCCPPPIILIFLLFFSFSSILFPFFLFLPFFPFYASYFLFSFSTLLFPCLPIFPFLSIPFVFSSFHFLRILYSCFFLFLSCSPPPIILIILLFFPIFHPFKLSFFQLYLSCRASLSFTNKSSTVLVERC